jgi:hypothetical protein
MLGEGGSRATERVEPRALRRQHLARTGARNLQRVGTTLQRRSLRARGRKRLGQVDTLLQQGVEARLQLFRSVARGLDRLGQLAQLQAKENRMRGQTCGRGRTGGSSRRGGGGGGGVGCVRLQLFHHPLHSAHGLELEGPHVGTAERTLTQRAGRSAASRVATTLLSHPSVRTEDREQQSDRRARYEYSNFRRTRASSAARVQWSRASDGASIEGRVETREVHGSVTVSRCSDDKHATTSERAGVACCRV